jgi:hypothetical protein
VSKHASTPPPRGTSAGRAARIARLKVIASVVVVVAFVALFVGGAVGLIGKPDEIEADLSGLDSPPPTVAEENTPGAGDVGDRLPSSEAPSAEPTPTAPATPVVSDVPPQQVVGAQRLKRSVEWLRRGLADETTFRVATFNVLGASHTASGGNRKGWASGETRMGWAWSMIANSGASVVGFQELEDPQYDRMLSLSGWQAYPGRTLDRGSIRNSLAWDPDVWSLVEARSIGIPYFGGQIIRRPVVRLQNIESGREVWFFNTHNPATTPRWGNNARWRAAAISLEIQLANELGADGTPVVFTGDFNDREAAFCPLVGGTDLAAANGGSADGGCAPPSRMDVDWVFGSGIQWSDFASVSDGVVGRVSDHPFVSATAYVPEEPIPGTTPTPSDDATESEDATTD